jgi:hypothetical protein
MSTHVANGYELGSKHVRKVEVRVLLGNARRILVYALLPANGRG